MSIQFDGDIDKGIHKWSGTVDGKEWSLFCGDAAEALKNIEPESIHCIITSPPQIF